MSDLRCEEVRERLALGEPAHEGDLSRHITRCEGCRLEAERIGALLGLLARDAELDPPEHLDALVRTLLATPSLVRSPVARPFFRPGIAAGLAGAGFLALLTALAVAWAQAGAAEKAPLMAIVFMLFYVGLSMTATLPLWFLRHKLGLTRGSEVWT